MNGIEQEITNYKNRIKACTTMTQVLVTMSSWQSFCDSHVLTKEQAKEVEQAYLKAEEELITKVKPSLW